MTDLEQLRNKLREFANEREWDQFHSPKNLAMALNVEAGELLEHFQWLTEEQSRNLTEHSRQQVAYEMADVLVYLIRLEDKLGIDLLRETEAKLELNALKYPADKVRGSAKKYDEY